VPHRTRASVLADRLPLTGSINAIELIASEDHRRRRTGGSRRLPPPAATRRAGPRPAPCGVAPGSTAGERPSPLRGLTSTTGCVVSPLGSLTSPLGRAVFVLGGLASSSPLLPLGMRFRERRAPLKRRGRSLIGLRQTLE